MSYTRLEPSNKLEQKRFISIFYGARCSKNNDDVGTNIIFFRRTGSKMYYIEEDIKKKIYPKKKIDNQFFLYVNG